MLASVSQEPDQSGTIIFVGQDGAGHWLVQDNGKRLEGCFISLSAAMSYAHGERDLYHAVIKLSSTPLTPLISYDPVPARDCALARAD